MRTGGRQAVTLTEDELLSRLYQRLADEHEAVFAASYNFEDGLRRYELWLATGQSGALTGTGWSRADRAVEELYTLHYKPLVGLATLLLRDVGAAEEVVQEAFIEMHKGWLRLRDSEKALSYLRQTVVSRSRSVLRHRVVVDRNVPIPAPDMPSAEHGAFALLERSAVIAVLRQLPVRQREALVLRFYADMSEEQVADAMGISRGAVRSHLSRAMAALRDGLERDDQTARHPRPQSGPGPDAAVKTAPGGEPA